MIGLRILERQGWSKRNKLTIRPEVFRRLNEDARDGDTRALAYLKIVKTTISGPAT